VQPFDFYEHRRNDYGTQDYVHLLSPATLSRLEPICDEIDFALLESLITQTVEKNAAEERDFECRRYFGGREPRKLLRDYCTHSLYCCQESRKSGWALNISVC